MPRRDEIRWNFYDDEALPQQNGYGALRRRLKQEPSTTSGLMVAARTLNNRLGFKRGV